jgi:hypothetical protein
MPREAFVPESLLDNVTRAIGDYGEAYRRFARERGTTRLQDCEKNMRVSLADSVVRDSTEMFGRLDLFGKKRRALRRILAEIREEIEKLQAIQE